MINKCNPNCAVCQGRGIYTTNNPSTQSMTRICDCYIFYDIKENIMTKEEAKTELRKAKSDLRQANVVLEMHEQGIKEIEDKIAELQAIINKPDRWQDSLVQPDKGQYFYLVSNTDKGLDVGLNSVFNRKPEHAFKTEEQAELIKEKMLLMQEMHAFAHVKNEGWKPNWDDEDESKWGIAIYENKCLIENFYDANYFIFGIAVKSEEIAKEMLEEFGERIEKVYNKQY